jgi:hypothetical protein
VTFQQLPLWQPQNLQKRNLVRFSVQQLSTDCVILHAIVLSKENSKLVAHHGAGLSYERETTQLYLKSPKSMNGTMR